MRFLSSLLLALSLAVALTGCGLLKFGKKKEPAAPGMVTIGIIEMVNPEQKYVLIRCDLLPSYSTGAELVSINAAGAESKLAVTPEHKNYYLTADIKSGSPDVGNLVMRRLTLDAISKPTPTITPADNPTPAPPPISSVTEAPKPPLPSTPEPPLPLPQNTPQPAAPTFEPVVK